MKIFTFLVLSIFSIGSISMGQTPQTSTTQLTIPKGVECDTFIEDYGDTRWDKCDSLYSVRYLRCSEEREEWGIIDTIWLCK